MKTDSDGRGMVNILVADKPMQSPGSTPPSCCGCCRSCLKSCRKPATCRSRTGVLLRRGASVVQRRAEGADGQDRAGGPPDPLQGRRRYFATQNLIDVPYKLLAQLGGRVQHALRAFTPRDQQAVNAAAQTFRRNPKLDTARVIMELGKGEALVSFLEGGGTPTMVERVMIQPLTARIGPITPEERKAIISKEPAQGQIRHRGPC